ncbi:spermidine synthase [Saccharococcus caldoxylosilyticus]|uniref:spermine/spermidine synthase domain-containing protein n=1 Tax=Saccharococcus caldoxylosilyticus TaxID=81408 RepID=UPI003D32C347
MIKLNDSLQPNSTRGDVYDLIEMEQLLAGPHRIIYEGSSQYQDILLIESKNIRLYWNNQLELNSLDERIYHEALVHLAMTLAAQHDRVLVIGGEDGCAIHEVLKYPNVNHVSLIAVSPETLHAAQNIPEITELNEGSLFDKRVHIHESDIHEFLSSGQQLFHVIIVDLPDPETEATSRFYTMEFFHQLSNFLTDDGILVCQSTSPEHTPLVFWSIARTLEQASLHTLSYHVLVPWFGDWGFHLAGKGALVWGEEKKVAVSNRSLSDDLISLFTFSPKVLNIRDQAVPNTLDCLILHKFYEASEVETVPEKGLSVFYNLQHSVLEQDNDTEDLIEIQQLLSGPHRVLYQGGPKGDHVLMLETTDVRLYLDKQLQFSSLDEQIYHEALVHPALAMVQKRDRILIAGGGDGLAIREILKYPDVKHIDLVDLDPLMLHIARNVPEFVTLNNGALHDERVSIHQQDILVFKEMKREPYDVIIVDLPDPGDEIISRLYTVEFFGELSNLLHEDGILVCQSHSPEYAPLVFWSIGLTLKGAGFHILSYHVDVPSFGDWGFHLAAKKPLLWGKREIAVPHHTLPEDLSSWFDFPEKIRSIWANSHMNTLSNLKLHQFYFQEIQSD